MYEVHYVSPWGRSWPLMAPETYEVFVREGGFSDLGAPSEDRVVSSDGVPGQLLAAQSFGAVKGSMTVHVRGGRGLDPARVWSGFRRSWSRTLTGTLVVVTEPWGRLSLPVRLAKPLPDIQTNPEDEDWEQTIEVSFVGDSGLWRTGVFGGEGAVEVSNSGDAALFPSVRWSGKGGEVVMPSGYRFTLPKSKDERVLVMDNSESCVVLDADGEVDRSLWNRLKGKTLPEGVPIGKTRSFTVPAGARLEYRIGFADPWQ